MPYWKLHVNRLASRRWRGSGDRLCPVRSLTVPTLSECSRETVELGERTDGTCEVPKILCAVDELSDPGKVRVLPDLLAQLVEDRASGVLSDLERPLANLLKRQLGLLKRLLETRSADGRRHVGKRSGSPQKCQIENKKRPQARLALRPEPARGRMFGVSTLK
jgi:hypothetical protein